MNVKTQPVVGEIRKPVGIWIRVSTENQAQGDSPEHHEQRARMFAQARGWEVKEVYHLEAVSGKSVMEHAEAKRMLADVRRRHISALIFSKLARLARNTKELLEFADIFRELGADLVSLQESIDTSTPAGRLFYSMIAAMAQWEREEIADRINASIAIRAKLGKPLNGKAPFGYHWVDKKLVPHPQEGPVRRLLYELYAEHRRKKKVIRILNEGGYRTRDGHLWTDTSLQRLLQDTTAKGMHRANYSKQLGNVRAVKPEDQWVWIPCDPVVSQELWERCNVLLDQNHHEQRRGRSPVQLFAGVTYCHCGKKMYVPSNTPKYVCQTCRNKIPVIDLEAIFVEQLKNFFLSPEEIGRQLEAADQDLKVKEHLLSVLRKEQEKLDQEIKRVYQLYVDEKLDGDGFARFYRPLEERRKQVEDELPRLQAEVDLLKIDHLSADQIVSEAQDLYGRWEHLEREEKHRVIQSITERIVIGPGDEIVISLCHLPSSEELTKEQRNFRSA
jgi:site-specific DNA recombinase